MEIWDTTYNRLNRRQRTMATYGNALIVIIKKNKKRERGGGVGNIWISGCVADEGV